jgi:hypothetical protein
LNKPGGWRIDLEDFANLDDNFNFEDELFEIMRSGYEANDFDAREILKVENQGGQGACQGHGISSTLEMASCIAIGEKSLELSRAMGYYETQRIDGIQGDRGSTISGGVKLAENTGICREDLWKYPSRYSNKRPSDWNAVLKSAERFKSGKSVRIRSWDGLVTFLEAGLGAVTIGIRWNSSVNREHVTDFRGGSGGGHAICLPQMSKKRPGEVDMMNSWGERWGDGGWATWTRGAFEQMLKDRFTVAIGVSDMINLEPRKVTFTEFLSNITV